MFLSHFAEVFECLLLLLLNMLIDLTDELDVLCRSLATLSTSASLYSILTNQIKFPPPQPGYQVFNFPTTPSPQPPLPPPPPPPAVAFLVYSSFRVD